MIQRHVAAIVIPLGLLFPVALAAQQRDSVSAGQAEPRTIQGIVTDSAGMGIDSAEVFIATLRRGASAGRDGNFRFTDVKPGTYVVAARRLGFYPQTRTVTVEKAFGVSITFALVPFVRSLPPVASSSSRGGLSGVVGDTAFAAIGNAEISVVAGVGNARSDSTGSFFIDVKPGKYMVRIKRDGFASQLVAVTIPRDSGRRILVLLKPTLRDESAREKIAEFELEARLVRRNSAYARLITREDINRAGWVELTEIAQSGTGRRVDPSCMAVVDGGPRSEFLWALRASDVEAVEVYRARPVRMQVRSITGGGRQIVGSQPIGVIQADSRDCPDEIYVWLRK